MPLNFDCPFLLSIYRTPLFVLDGQLCYNIDISSIIPPSYQKTKDGKVGGLMLVLDYNRERSIHPRHLDRKVNKTTGKFHISLEDTPDEDDREARVFIHTLKKFDGYGGGSYAMKSLKKITPTEDFLKLPLAVKECVNEDKQYCRMKKYLEEGRQKCGCIPWEFLDAGFVKVNFVYWQFQWKSPTN